MHFRKSKNSWHYCKPIDECHTLFEKQTLGYFAHFFFCRCGKEEAYLSDKKTYTYQCCVCHNEGFLEKDIVKEPNIYDAVDVSYEYTETDDGLRGTASVYYPVDANFLRKKMIFERYIVVEVFRRYPGSHLLSSRAFDNKQITKKLIRGLQEYALGTYKDIELLRGFRENVLDFTEKLSVIFFSIKYPKLENIEFYFWARSTCLPKLYHPKRNLSTLDALIYLINDRKERSIKKAVFERHKQLEFDVKKIGSDSTFSLDSISSFSPQSIFVISRCIQDPNIATMLIRKQALFHPTKTYPIKLNDTIWLLMFLKKHYSEANIAKLLLSASNHFALWVDTIRMATTQKHAIKKEFKKVKLSVQHLHDAFRSIMHDEHTKQDRALTFSYTDIQKDACIKVADLEFRLPHTGNDLYRWGEDLNNCLFAYKDSIAASETVIYGVFRDSKMLYAVEISDNTILQASGKHNQDVASKDYKVIESWFGAVLETKEKIPSDDQQCL